MRRRFKEAPSIPILGVKALLNFHDLYILDPEGSFVLAQIQKKATRLIFLYI